MGAVRNAVIKHVRAKNQESNQAWEDTHHYDEPRLFVSDVGHCPRAAYYNAFGHFEDHPFDDYVAGVLEQLGRARGVGLRGRCRVGGQGQQQAVNGLVERQSG